MSGELDYILFLQGVAFLLLALVLWRGDRAGIPRPGARRLAGFALLQGSWAWLELWAFSVGDSEFLSAFRLLLPAASFLALWAFVLHVWKARSARVPGRWIYPVLLLLAAPGMWAGMDGLRAALSAGLGMPAGLLAGWLLIRGGPGVKDPGLPGLRIAGASLLTYAPVTGWLGVHAFLFPAAAPDGEFFSSLSPVFWAPWVVTACAAAATWGVYRAHRSRPGGAESSNWYLHRLTPALVVLALVFGWWMTHHLGRVTDTNLRDRLLYQARTIARTVNPNHIQALAFAPEDLGNPHFRRLRHQLRAYAESLGHRSIYTLALRDDSLVFGPESLDEDDPWASPPGTVYLEPGPEDWEIFEKGKSYVGGPFSDEYGTFVSALAPVRTRTGAGVAAAVGMDMDASSWGRSIARSRLASIGFTLALVLILAAGGVLLQRRNRLPQHRRRRWGYAEAWITGAVGAVLTLGAAGLLHDAEARSRRAAFSQITEAVTWNVMDALFDIRDHQLNGMARFFEGSEEVTREEFRAFTGPLAAAGEVQAWAWIPRVPAQEKDRFEETVRRNGLPDFVVHATGPGGDAVPVTDRDEYHPILYVEPLRGNESMPGYDVGSESLRRAALEESLRVGLTTGTDPVPRVRKTETQKAILVFRPVFEKGGNNPRTGVEGFVAAAIRMESLLRNTLARSGDGLSLVRVELVQLESGEAPLTLASFPPEGRDAAPVEMMQSILRPEFAGLAQVLPLFVFGKAYALVCLPGADFSAMLPRRAGARALMAGLFVTGVLVAFVSFLLHRRADLEALVRTRTGELRDSEERLRQVTDAMNEVFWLRSAGDGRFLYVNPAYEGIWGRTCGSLYEDPRTFLESVHPEDREAVLSGIAPNPGAGISDLEYRVVRPDGDTRWVWARELPIQDEQGIVIRHAGIAVDITERRRAEEEKEHLREQLLQIQKLESIGRLAGGVAHDFNNMLGVIIGHAEMALLTLKPDESVCFDLREILTAAHRSADLTRQLLGFARKQTISPKPLDLNDAVSGMIKMLRRLIGEDIELSWSPGPDLWNVRMDPTQIDQLLANLMVNARDAVSGPGRIALETRNVEFDESVSGRDAEIAPGAYVMLAVSDTGCGMDRETLERVFEPFFTTKEVGKGTGLGLATVYGIVKQNGGVIHVYSEPGNGTTFKIYLPRLDIPASGAPAEVREAKPRGGTETVLIVEDEEPVLLLGKRILDRLGYAVLAARTAEEAMHRAEAHTGEIHLLLTDVVMPGLNGRELRDRLRKPRPSMKCLFMSGYTADVIAHRGVLEADVQFITKPFTVRELGIKVREALDRE